MTPEQAAKMLELLRVISTELAALCGAVIAMFIIIVLDRRRVSGTRREFRRYTASV